MRITNPAIGDVYETYHDDWPVARQNCRPASARAREPQARPAVLRRSAPERVLDLRPGQFEVALDLVTGPLARRRQLLAMVLAGLRRCEVLGLRLADVRVAGRRLFAAEGKGGHQRVIPVADRFLAVLGDYLHDERPAASSTDRLFVVLKGPRRGLPLSAEGLDEILAGARWRAGLEHATCHELRHTCLTRLREAGMALEAVQAQAGHRSIESARVYLHLTNDWLAGQYRRAAALIDADQAAVAAMLAVQEVAGR